MKSYKGQALAIVLALLIIGSMVGFALYVRLARESSRIADEKSSAEANELVETVIGLVSTSDYGNIKGEEALFFLGCEEDDLWDSSGCRRSAMDLGELSLYFDSIGLEDVDPSVFDFGFEPGFCLSEIAMRYGLEGDEITIRQDGAYAVLLSKVDWNSCKIDFFMTGNGVAEGFVMSTFYGEHDVEGNIQNYKDYEFEDILGFSYFEPDTNWVSYESSSEALSFPDIYPVFKDDYMLNEVRFKSLKDSSNLRWEITGDCFIDDYLLMEVGSTCGGKYVGKNFAVPGALFAPPVFDYVLFNGHGDLLPSAIRE